MNWCCITRHTSLVQYVASKASVRLPSTIDRSDSGMDFIPIVDRITFQAHIIETTESHRLRTTQRQRAPATSGADRPLDGSTEGGFWVGAGLADPQGGRRQITTLQAPNRRHADASGAVGHPRYRVHAPVISPWVPEPAPRPSRAGGVGQRPC